MPRKSKVGSGDGGGSKAAGKKKEKPHQQCKAPQSLREEMQALRSQLDTTNADRTPLSGETLRQFYRYIGFSWPPTPALSSNAL